MTVRFLCGWSIHMGFSKTFFAFPLGLSESLETPRRRLGSHCLTPNVCACSPTWFSSSIVFPRKKEKNNNVAFNATRVD